MSDAFQACTLPWSIWPWGITLTHSDTDMWPECSVEFGAMMPRPTPPSEEFWVRLDFELAAFASTKPHRDDENLLNVSVTTSSRGGGLTTTPRLRTTRLSGFERVSVPIRASTFRSTRDGWRPSGVRGRPDSGRTADRKMRCISCWMGATDTSRYWRPASVGGPGARDGRG
jgi:hypothetical protein